MIKTISTPIGRIFVPDHIVKSLDEKTDEQLITEYNEMKKKGFIDPFLYNEIKARKIIL
jgi:hypothetical protein